MALGVPEFEGTPRFSIRRRLGAGGMGVVYEAHDRERHELVALKTLQSPTAPAIRRLQEEFHALKKLQHPNLVGLKDLFEHEGVWFFTMELVEGRTFLQHVRPARAQGVAVGGAAPVAAGFDDGRLRDALAQLARGLSALHAAGKVHRDVKPSNILVDDAGRVVLLDFGLVAEAQLVGAASEDSAVGTVAYMAPEQAVGHAASPAADWYSVGVMLHEALVGAPPFVGANLQVLIDKQRLVPARAATRVAGVPADLDDICAELLERAPGKRPSGRAILRRLGIRDGEAGAGVPASAQTLTHAPLFVGRDAELEALDAALAQVRAHRALVSVRVIGASGIGKSALVKAFLERVAGSATVLEGRFGAHPVVPHGGFDGVMRSLASQLARLGDAEAAALVPEHAALLTKVFAVFNGLEAYANAPVHDVVDPQERRTRLFATVRELLARLARQRPVILVLEDVERADADALALLDELTWSEESPPLLLLSTCAEPRADLPGDARRVELAPLAEDAACDLALRLLAQGGDPDRVRGDAAASIAAAARGHPLHIMELTRQTLLSRAAPAADLDGLLAARIVELEPDARRVLETLALAAQPLDLEVLAAASSLDLATAGRQLAMLHVAQLAHPRNQGGMESFEPYHERVRAAVLARLTDAAASARHGELARALDASGRVAPAVLVEHYRGAGERERAGLLAVTAAEAAERALAFAMAARLYQLALELLPAEHPRRRTLRVSLGDALAGAARGAEAAAAYLAAVEGANAAEALELQTRAAQNLLVTGHVDQGIAAIRSALAQEGIEYPRTHRRALAAYILHRAQLRLRGLAFRSRDVSLVPAKELTRLDACTHAGISLGLVDTMRARCFTTQAFLLALRAGEPLRLARAFAFEGGFLGGLGGPFERKSDALFVRAEELAHEVGDAGALARLAMARGVTAFFMGRFRLAVQSCDEAEAMLRTRCTSAPWEIALGRVYVCRALQQLGQYALLARRLRDTQHLCRSRGDLISAMTLGVSVAPMVHLARGAPALARAAAEDALRAIPGTGFRVQDYFALFADASASLYEQRAGAAHETLLAAWKAMTSSMITHAQVVRVAIHDLRARAALARALAHAGSTRRELLGAAARDVRLLEREHMPWASAFATILRAQLAAAQGDAEAARRGLLAADADFVAADMALHAAAARRCLGQLVGGDEGRALVAAADGWMAAQAIRDPARMSALLAPGFAS